MTPEVWTIVGTGIALAAIILGSARTQRQDSQGIRREIEKLKDGLAELREHMAKLEGLLEGLREAIAGRHAA